MKPSVTSFFQETIIYAYYASCGLLWRDRLPFLPLGYPRCLRISREDTFIICFYTFVERRIRRLLVLCAVERQAIASFVLLESAIFVTAGGEDEGMIAIS